jgi:hypothetical protein
MKRVDDPSCRKRQDLPIGATHTVRGPFRGPFSGRIGRNRAFRVARVGTSSSRRRSGASFLRGGINPCTGIFRKGESWKSLPPSRKLLYSETIKILSTEFQPWSTA